MAVVAVGSVSVTHSLAMTLKDEAPERAYVMAPWDGQVAALFARTLFGVDASPAAQTRAGQIALAALRSDPTVVPAVTTLAIRAQVEGDTGKTRRLFAYAQSLSRRDLVTQLWMIEDAVERGDIPGAMRNYDIALRTSRFTPQLLYPTLTTAMDDPAIRRALVETLSRQPLWITSFVEHVANNGEPMTAAQLFQDLSAVQVPIPQDARADVIEALIRKQRFSAAWNYYRSIRRGTDPRMSRDPEFSAALESPTAFDWRPVIDNAGISAVIQPGEQNGVFDFAVPATIGGTVLQQMQLLPPGRYDLTGRSEDLEQPADTRPYWALQCDTGRELGRIDMPNSAEDGGRFAGSFTIPSDCRAQNLKLVVRPSNSVAGVTGKILSVQLHPSGSTR
ncbi:hypothetical protein JW805_20895 [Roseomonas aeriglobus]|nr:hypothetical protein [Roseomonas aeriglobus]